MKHLIRGRNVAKQASGQAPEVELSRRNFLSSAGIAVVSVGVLGSGLLASADAWANGALDKQASLTLLQMARDLFPNDDLEDIHYANIIAPMGKQANEDASLKKQLNDGAAELDKRAMAHFGKPFAEVKQEDDRVIVLTEIESTEFFNTLRNAVMMGIYNKKELWPRFGYGGSSWEKGGYLHRGFDELDWLKA
ncbi:gluconate 2-dehydrogenase subunit 3 family protein [Leucothrix mucor]|uniref:gluconate 2-dehydrogenase subunit 3 family protein n=1 Tax=Leucothrix mucor TaxID=45248 RepID=UPI0003B3F436|nr:gluconate 2-dehydrogenase subunit 3 family protein [Leucothrix mucor]